jgi:ATP-dependent Clp protease adapter protein ClpS
MLQVHTKGIAKVCILPSKDHAETKACVIMSEAREKGFPFQVSFEKED